MSTHRLSDDAACNACGYHYDQTTGLTGGHVPSPGDISLCIACGTPEKFALSDHGLITTTLPLDELVSVMSDPRVAQGSAYIKAQAAIDPSWPKGTRVDPRMCSCGHADDWHWEQGCDICLCRRFSDGRAPDGAQ